MNKLRHSWSDTETRHVSACKVCSCLRYKKGLEILYKEPGDGKTWHPGSPSCRPVMKPGGMLSLFPDPAR